MTDLHRCVTDVADRDWLISVTVGLFGALEAGAHQGVPVIAAANKSAAALFNIHILALASLSVTPLLLVRG